MTVTSMVLLSPSAVESGPSCSEAREDHVISEDLARGLCDLWAQTCGQGHASLFDRKTQSGRAPEAWALVSRLRTEGLQPVPPPLTSTFPQAHRWWGHRD